MAEDNTSFRLPAIVTVLVYVLNARSGIAVGRARHKYNVPVPQTKGPPEFDRAFRAHANNAEQYPQFLALMWVTAVFVNGVFAGVLGVAWIVLRNLYVSQYHRSGELTAITRYTIPIMSTYSVSIISAVAWSAVESHL